jgi:hypothetical protein
MILMALCKLILLYLNLYRKVLEEHKLTCAKEGRYVGNHHQILLFTEAEMAKNRIIELKQRMQTNMMSEFLSNQEREREEVE